MVNLVLESGILRVRDANGSTQFELQIKKGSLDNVDMKVSPLASASGKINL
jgi:hypothetical protein